MISVGLATESELQKWDSMINISINGTIFHRRKFLAYHQDRFLNTELFLVFRKGDTPIALMTLAVEAGSRHLKSPYGGSYGGVVFLVKPDYGVSADVANALVEWLRSNAFSSIAITAPLNICSSFSQDVFHFCLLKSGFVTVNRDISSYFNFAGKDNILESVSGRARNMYRKAERSGVTVVNHVSLDVFWPILMLGFSKHGVQPTHSFNDLDYLIQEMPESISFHVAQREGVTIAGLCEFVINSKVNSSFYFCQDPSQQQYQGLSMLVVDALERAQSNFEYYDFGTSTVQMNVRESVFKFKESFSADGCFRETLCWSDHL